MCTVEKFVDEFRRQCESIAPDCVIVPAADEFLANSVRRDGSVVVPAMVEAGGDTRLIGAMRDWPTSCRSTVWTYAMQAFHLAVMKFNGDSGRECAVTRMTRPGWQSFAFAVEIFDRRTGPDGVK